MNKIISKLLLLMNKNLFIWEGVSAQDSGMILL